MNVIDEAISILESGGYGQPVIELLKSIKENNRGYKLLGNPSAVVITYPAQAPEEVYDAVRFYAKAWAGGDQSAANLRTCAHLCSEEALKVAPDWWLKFAGHVDTESFTRLLYQTMVEIELNQDNLSDMSVPYSFDSSKRREELLFKGIIKSIYEKLESL